MKLDWINFEILSKIHLPAPIIYKLLCPLRQRGLKRYFFGFDMESE
jgi:hypothetical protein